MSYPAIVGAGLMIVSAFAIAVHKPRIGANGSQPRSALVLRAPGSTTADVEKPITATGLPTAPDDE